MEVFDVAKGERLIRRMKASILTAALPTYLNCNRVQAQELVRSGIIQRVCGADKLASGKLKQIAQSDADSFLDTLLDRVTQLSKVEAGMVQIMVAAEQTRWPMLDIVQGILDRTLARTAVADPSEKFQAIFVDPTEVRSALQEKQAVGLLCMQDAVAELGLGYSTFLWIGQTGKQPGSAHLDAA